MKHILRFLVGGAAQIGVLGLLWSIHRVFGDGFFGQWLFLTALISVQVYSTWALGKSLIK